MISTNLSPATRWGLNGALILAGVVALYFGHSIFIPTTLALFLAAVLGPAAMWLNTYGVPFVRITSAPDFPWIRLISVRLKVPWTLACTVVVGAMVALVVLVTLNLGLAIPKMLQDLGDDRRQTKVYDEFRKKLEVISPVPLDDTYFPEKAADSALFQSIRQALDPRGPYILKFLGGVASYGSYLVWEWILIMFILLFLLLEGRMLMRRVVEIFGPSLEVQTKVKGALGDMADQIRTYIVWRTIVNFGLGLLLGLVYQYLGLSQPWTWAILTAVLCYIPYIGPIAASVPPIIDAFVTAQSPWTAVVVLLFYLVVINVEGYLIVPVVMGRPMQLNATTVLLACLFWELVWGTPGLFLAMPLMAAIKAVCSHVPEWQAWANLMSTREPAPESVPAPQVIEPLLEDTQLLAPSEEAAVGAGRASAEPRKSAPLA